MILRGPFFHLAVLTGVLILIGDALDWWGRDWPLAVWQWLRGLDARIWQAVIAGAFVALGWVVNGMQERRSKAALRAEKLRDFHKALFAEIRTTLAALNEDDPSVGARIAASITDANKPFIPLEQHDRVFRTVLEDIDILPRQTIDAIVGYYGQISALEAMTKDMRTAAAGDMSGDRYAEMYRDYLKMRRTCFAWGEYTLELISAYSTGGADAADAKARAINSRASARSARPQASGTE